MVYSIVPAGTALLLIDAQREYFDEDRPLYIPHADAIKANLVRLRDAADRCGAATVLVLHVHKADGSDVGRMGDFNPTPVFIEGTPGADVIDELQPRKTDIVVTKTRYSAFVGTGLNETLRSGGIDTVLITGLMTNYCSVTTARHAHDLDYKVIFVHDANAGPDMPNLGFGPVPHDQIMQAIATTLAGGVADVVTTDEVLEMMQPK